MDWKEKLSQLAQKENIILTSEPILSAIDKQKAEQPLLVTLDNKHRKGKTATLITGLMMMPEAEVERVAQILKKRCGVGGSYRDGEILLQGDFQKKALEILIGEGYYKAKIK